MLGVVIDFETNGFSGSSVLSAAAIKIFADWDNGTVKKIETFTRHYHPIEKWNRYAQAVNKLSPTKIDALRNGATYPINFRDDSSLYEFANDATFAVAHNASFDSRFISLNIPWICTMKHCGGKLANAAYSRGIAVDESSLHQALYDTELCLALFEHLLITNRINRPKLEHKSQE